MQPFEFWAPTRIVYAPNALAATVNEQLNRYNAKRCFIITSPTVGSSSKYSELHRRLGTRLVGEFNHITPHPSISMVAGCIKKVRRSKADSILSVGGGSTIDTGKAASLSYYNGPIMDFEVQYAEAKGLTFPSRKTKTIPHLAIPTTYSGSETNPSIAVVDSNSRKRILWSPSPSPNVAVLDPILSISLPPLLSAASGMNCLAHCIEAEYSTLRQPLSESLVLYAIRKIFEWLPRCVSNPSDIEARSTMQVVSAMVGCAFGNSIVSLHHAICHVIGGLYKIHHGIVNSVMLPYVLEFMLNPPSPISNEIAKELAKACNSFDDHAPVDQIRHLRRELNLPESLAAIEVPANSLGNIARLTMQDWVIHFSPKPVNRKSVVSILKRAYKGEN